ncbi:hypothetical protein ACQP1P_13530 [Dactylosporangium sp. CA-052675]|uniref:hypothetical protein n=1 Tax=Dactylosporangium sp. CA-052675 TaxID=3239927 RepID=UPI003D94FE22
MPVRRSACRSAAPRTARRSIVLPAALGRWLDVAPGLETGADDSVVQPFGPLGPPQRIEQLAGPAGGRAPRPWP